LPYNLRPDVTNKRQNYLDGYLLTCLNSPSCLNVYVYTAQFENVSNYL